MASLIRLHWRALAALALAAAIFAVAVFAGPYRWAVFQPELGRRSPAGIIIGQGDCPAAMQWHSIGVVIQSRLAADSDGCSVTAKGPWWFDPNHAWPFGTGRINILLVTWARTADFISSGYDNTQRPADLRQRTLRIDFTVSGDVGRQPIHFWIQSKGHSRRPANYYLRQRLNSELTPEPRRYLVTIPLNRASQFSCMGAHFRRIRTYGCDTPVDEALADVDLDMGIISYGDGGHPAEGRFTLRRFRID